MIHTWLWVGTIGMALGLLVIVGAGNSVPAERRHHVVVSGFVVVIAACAYFAMANNQGVHSFVDNDGVERTVYYARYLDWVLKASARATISVPFDGVNALSSAPLVVVAGHEYTGEISDGTAFQTFVMGIYSEVYAAANPSTATPAPTASPTTTPTAGASPTPSATSTP